MPDERPGYQVRGPVAITVDQTEANQEPNQYFEQRDLGPVKACTMSSPSPSKGVGGRCNRARREPRMEALDMPLQEAD